MKKTGMCVCYTNHNYGSMLQSFATLKAFGQQGLDCEFIRYEKKKDIYFFIKSAPRVFNRITLSDKYLVVQKKINLIRHKDAAKENSIRDKAFDRFEKKYFTRLSPVYHGYEALKEAAGKYAGVISGSDQVWSPSALATHFYDLTFVPDEVPKVSYASSFGVKKIPSYQFSRTKKYLHRINHVSVREINGRQIIKELTGRDVPVVCDPTLLFNEKSWAKFLPPEKLIGEKYIFAYFLGASESHRKAAMELSEKTGLKIATIHHMDQFVKADVGFGDIVYSDAGPEEFVNLIRGAQCVCTDSFHGTIFSVIHHKPFVVFNRYTLGAADSKNSRIDSLCALLGLENRRFSGSLCEEMESAIDFDEVDRRAENLRDISEKYIYKAAQTIKENL